MSIIPTRRTFSKKDVTVEALKEASLIIAEVVKIYGDAYLSIFVRILKEIEHQKESQNYRAIALQMLKDGS